MVGPIEFAKLKVRDSTHWTWQLHENQSYLGRLVLHLKRDSESSIAKLREDEWKSLHDEISLAEFWLSELFFPDRFNYAQLGNVYPRLHVHVVPRYRTPRDFMTIRFEDKKWGKNWAPTPPSPLDLTGTYEMAQCVRDRFRNDLAVAP